MGLVKLTDQLSGRKVIKTNLVLTGNPREDIITIPKILEQTLPIHRENVEQMNKLFSIYFNDNKAWQKIKTTRGDINNKIGVPNAWAISRTINGYCFGEPIKYVARNDTAENQSEIEKLSSWLDYRANHTSTIMATLTASVCGLGYKLALMTNDTNDEIPFVINDEIIYPQNAFVVYNNKAIRQKVMGVFIGDNYNDKNEKDGLTYTVWTNTHQYIFIENKNSSGEDNKFVAQEQPFGKGTTYAYPLVAKKIPLVEIERNPFRKGDWEVIIDLINLKNLLLSNRIDDIQQVVDYVLVLINCQFENDADKKNILRDRLLELTVKDPQNKPSVEILKNALDQTGVQILADFIDLLIQECVGIPNRQERGGGGGDTGQAVQYRNGFRDLENNAGLIIPKMDKAELEFLSICISYAEKFGKKLGNLKPYDIRCKFIRSLNDDPVASSQAYVNCKVGGMNDLDALIVSKLVTDASEVAKNNKNAFENGLLKIQIEEKAKKGVFGETTIQTPTPKEGENNTDNNGE